MIASFGKDSLLGDYNWLFLGFILLGSSTETLAQALLIFGLFKYAPRAL